MTGSFYFIRDVDFIVRDECSNVHGSCRVETRDVSPFSNYYRGHKFLLSQMGLQAGIGYWDRLPTRICGLMVDMVEFLSDQGVEMVDLHLARAR